VQVARQSQEMGGDDKGSVGGRMAKGVGKGVGKGLGKTLEATGRGTAAGLKKAAELNEEHQYTNRAGAAALKAGEAGARTGAKAGANAFDMAHKKLVAEEGDEMVAPMLVDADHQISTGLDAEEYGPDEMWNQQLFTGGSPADLLELACEDPNHVKVPKWWSAKVPANDEAVSSGSGRNLLIQERTAGLRKSVWKEILQKSKLLFMLAKSAEETVTGVMREIEGATNGQLIGIEYRLKELPSIQRKLLFETSQSVSKTIQEVMNSRMTDTLRYTVLYETASYVEQAGNLVEMLCNAKKYQSFELRNYWETGHAYDGLNCSFLTDDHEAGGVLYEVQVHTPQSFDVKQYKSHALYELWRGIDDPMRKFLVFSNMVDLFDEVPRPPGDLLAIGTLNRKTSPEPEGYKEWLAQNSTDVEMLRQKNYSYFGVEVHEMERPEDGPTAGATRVADRGGLFSGGGGKFFNPMSSAGDLQGEAAAGMGGCFAKLFCCLKKTEAASEAPLMSGMRADGRAPIQNPMFAAPAAQEQEQFAFIRHGEAEHNVLFRAGKSAEGLELFDPPLTDKGRRQAEALGRYIQQEELQFDVVFVSPLMRALQTAEIVFSNFPNSRIVCCPLLSETGMDEPGNDRVGKPCRAGEAPRKLKTEFPGWDFKALDDRGAWAEKGGGAQGWAHPDPKESRVDPFREYLLNSTLSTDKVAIVGHAAFFQNFVDVKMTSCQMLWKEVARDNAVLEA
jgi:broad specificity phosphatase PhoE